MWKRHLAPALALATLALTADAFLAHPRTGDMIMFRAQRKTRSRSWKPVAAFLAALWTCLIVSAAAAESTVVEATPEIDIRSVLLEVGGQTVELAGRSPSADAFVFALDEGQSTVARLTVRADVGGVEGFAIDAMVSGHEIALLTSDEGNGVRTYTGSFYAPPGEPQILELRPRYRPRTMPLAADNFVQEDGDIEYSLSTRIAAQLRRGNTCEGALRSYFRGHRVVGVIIDSAQYTATFVATVIVDSAVNYITLGSGAAARRGVAAIGRAFLISAGSSYGKSFVDHLIQGEPLFDTLGSDLTSAFTSGVLDAAFHHSFSASGSNFLRWVDDTMADEFVEFGGRFAASVTTNTINWAANAGLREEAEELIDEMALEYRRILDAHGIGPAYFLHLRDDKVINGHRLVLGGMQWRVTGRGAIAVACTPPGADAPTRSFVVNFRYTENGGLSGLTIRRGPAVADGDGTEELTNALDMDRHIAEATENLTEALPDELVTANPRQTLEEGWRAARDHGPWAFMTGTEIPADQVPAGAAWKVDLDAVHATDQGPGRYPVGIDHLAGTELSVEATVYAMIGGAWLPVSDAEVEVVLDARPVGATTATRGRATVEIGTGAVIGRPDLILRVQGQPASTSRRLNIYDYVVEIERTDPASAFVEANGEDGIAVFARLRRRQVSDSGGDEFRNPGRSRAVDMEAVRFIGDHGLVLEGAGDRSSEARLYEVSPGEDGRFSFTVTSEQAGDFDLRTVGVGGRFRTRDDTLGTVTVGFSDAPVDLVLAFGPSMAAYEVNSREIRIEGIDVNELTEIELEIMAQWARGPDAGEPREGIEVRIEPEDGADIGVAGDILVTDGNGTARRESGGLPVVYRPGEGAQRLTVSAEGGNNLTVVIVGVDDGPDLALQAEVTPEEVNINEGTEARIAGSIVFPEGTDFSYLTGTHALNVEVDGRAVLEVPPEGRHGEVEWSSGSSNQRIATLRPDPESGEFSFTVSHGEPRDIAVRVFVWDRREGATVEELELTVRFVSEDRVETPLVFGAHDWTSSDGDQSLRPGPNYLTVDDLGNGWLTLTAPATYSGDWSAVSAIALEIMGTTTHGIVYPLVLTLANDENSAQFEFPVDAIVSGAWRTLESPLDPAGWSVTGNWEALITNVRVFSIRIDLTDGVGGEANSLRSIRLAGDIRR